MSRQNDPRTDGDKTKKGGKHTVIEEEMEKDKQEAIDSLHESDPTVPLDEAAAYEADPPKVDKPPEKTAKKSSNRASKTSKGKKVKPLPADLPETAIPFPMWRAQYFYEGEWYWSAPRRTINAALALNHYCYKKVEEVHVWLDAATDRFIRPMTSKEDVEFYF